MGSSSYPPPHPAFQPQWRLTVTAPRITRRASLLALSVGSGALATGTAITPAAADCHGGPLIDLGSNPVALRRRRRAERRATPPYPSATTLREAIVDLPRDGESEHINEDERGWLSDLFDTLDEALSDVENAVVVAFNRAEELYKDARDSIGGVARTIAATLVDEFEYLRDNLGEMFDISLANYIAWIAQNVHRAINGVLSAASLLRALGMPVALPLLMLGGLIAGIAEALSAYMEQNYEISEGDG